MTHQPNLIPNQPNPAQDERERTSAQLAGVGCCPICGEKLVERACPDCLPGWWKNGKPDYFHCPTCQNTGKVTICPAPAHRGE